MNNTCKTGLPFSAASPGTTRTAISFLLIGLLLVSCSRVSTDLRVYGLDYQHVESSAMQEIFEKQSGVRMVPIKIVSGSTALEALANNEVDLALVENSTPFVQGVRAVLPLYQSVLHLLVRSDLEIESVGNSLHDMDIHIPNDSRAGHSFLEVVARRQGLSEDDYRISTRFEKGVTDFVIYFGPINPQSSNWYQPGFRLVSLDWQANTQYRFFKDSISYAIPRMKQATIPAQTYQLPGNEEELLTVAVDTLMVTRKNVPVKEIYELAKTLIEQKPRFTALAPHFFSGISESFDPLDLSFPLHRGARRYLARDEPSPIERYAETINMLMYVVFLLLTSAVALSRWRSHRKKDRIDVFYTRVLAVRERASGEDHCLLKAELHALEQEAFESLIAEKLAADESFRIFTELLSRALEELDNS